MAVNDLLVTNYSVLGLPMGGWKNSGIGFRHGAVGIRKFCRPEAITVPRMRQPKREFLWFPYSARKRRAVRRLYRLFNARGLAQPARALSPQPEPTLPDATYPRGPAPREAAWPPGPCCAARARPRPGARLQPAVRVDPDLLRAEHLCGRREQLGHLGAAAPAASGCRRRRGRSRWRSRCVAQSCRSSMRERAASIRMHVGVQSPGSRSMMSPKSE